MQRGLVGLARVSSTLVSRLLHAGHACAVYNRHPEPIQVLAKEGATGTTSPAALVQKRVRPCVVWLMLPAAVVDGGLAMLVPLLDRGDVVVATRSWEMLEGLWSDRLHRIAGKSDTLAKTACFGRNATEAAGLYPDRSKNRITGETPCLLVSLAEECGSREWSDAMFRGETINGPTVFEGNGDEVDLVEGSDAGQMHQEFAAKLVKEGQ